MKNKTWSTEGAQTMYPRDVFNRAIVAAAVAEANGFHATSQAFQDLARVIYNLPEFAARKGSTAGPLQMESPAV